MASINFLLIFIVKTSFILTISSGSEIFKLGSFFINNVGLNLIKIDYNLRKKCSAKVKRSYQPATRS